jgi:hypothetical protein
MGETQFPFFRKTIAPWYDSNLICGIQIAVMSLVFIFACIGISAAGDMPQQGGVVWIPALLAFLSLIVMFTTILRLIRRRQLGDG